ncbi:HAMP domain-containing histidine kinase [Baekduia soli]|uniref:histidine kinase n=1 Tax=Baekduia soli TaxID=496014 RepID=A0A5B8UB22_9ACTN|nr:HAMP domain-containing sensor histidine kinase [Baekduia soli]QEC50383.1 HAMP domain-containing histidine kinase [Baekduia soli]
MSRLPLRLRVALAAAGGVLVAVAALAGAAQYLVRHELRASQDRGLRGRATDVARLSASAPALLTAPGALDAPYGGQDLLVEVVDRRGRIVARSSALGGRLLPTDALLTAAIRSGRTGYARAELSGEPLRVFAAPLPDAGSVAAGGAVLVASSAREIERTADHVRTLILLCALGAAALGGAIAALLTGRGLTPLRRLAAAAGDIERTGDSSRRLPAEARTGGEIEELTRTLNAMLASLEEARRSERRLLADASHELRTPVTALRGNLLYLGRHGAADPETIADLSADVDRLARLIDDLLVLERHTQAAATRAPVSLTATARAVARAAGDDAAVLAPDGDVVVRGDGDALRRALENLVANAQTHGRPPVRITVARSGGRARVTVADAGPGLGPEEAGAAFDRFWRGAGSRGRPGSGLGLAIVRATARAHGGDVEVAGAAFTLDLPAAGTIVREPSENGPSLGDVPLTT